MELLTAIGIGLMFAAGIFQLLRRNVVRSAIGLIIIANAVNLFLLVAGAYEGVAAPYVNVDAIGVNGEIQRSDALPQVLILTAIVISMGGFAMALAMIYVLSARYKTSDLDEVKGLKH
jgi:multicomponent Na+:H+ antiporter subunit C